MAGITAKGSVDLGTFTTSPRYKTIGIPATGVFRAGLRDTTVRRYLQPINPADTALDSLIIVVIATDSVGVADTATRVIDIVAGPATKVVSPINGDSVPAGVGLSVAARSQSPSGVSRIDIHVQGEKNWPTKFDTTFSQTYTAVPRDITFNAIARIPIDAPVRGRVTVTATSVDVNRQPGSSPPVSVFVRSASTAQPRVTQTVLPKSEALDTVIVHATGEGIVAVGLIIRDSTNTIVQRDSIALSSPYNANVTAGVQLNLAPSLQGKKLGITAFAVDQAGRIGYAVPTTKGSAEGNINFALVDSTLLVYGRTYPLPHDGPIGDVASMRARGNVFLVEHQLQLARGLANSAPRGCAERNRGRIACLGHVHLEESRYAPRGKLRRNEHQPGVSARRSSVAARRSAAPHSDAEHVQLHRHRAARRKHRKDSADRAGSVQLLGSPSVHRAVDRRPHLLLDASDRPGSSGTIRLARPITFQCPIRGRSGQYWPHDQVERADVRAVQCGLNRHRRDPADVD
jgi:hypothetical protein